MSEKYKLQELAKDLGLASKEITDLLSQHSDTPKKNTASLDKEELDLVFEQLTQSHQEKNFDRYFSEKEYPMIQPGGSGKAQEGPEGKARRQGSRPAEVPTKEPGQGGRACQRGRFGEKTGSP